MPAEPEEVHCRIITEKTEIEAVTPAWNALLDQSSCNRVFSSPVWFMTACQVDPGLSPCLLVGERRGIPVSFLPLAIEKSTETAVFPGSMNNYNDLITRKGDVVHTAASLFDFARIQPKPYRRMKLKWLRTCSNCVLAAAAFAGCAGRHSMVEIGRWKEKLKFGLTWSAG